MELTRISTIKSPRADRRVRLTAEVTYDDTSAGAERYWFDVPEKCADFLSISGNPWLACLLPLAVTLGEPLRIHRPVDRVLFENTHELMRIWKFWYPHLRVVPVEAELDNTQKDERPAKTAAFFSGGVDSFFTVLRHNTVPDSGSRTHIDDLLSVWGFDIPLRNADEFRRHRDRLQKAASDLGEELVDVATNLRETRLQQADWGRLYHGCALASVGLALEKKYSKLLIASSIGYHDLGPWGSHPLTDPLLSTSRTRIVHDGAAFRRAEKTEFVAKSDLAMRSLHVCWAMKSDKNCGTCMKCYRTMATLAALGALPRCETFTEGDFDLTRLARVYTQSHYDRDYFREIRRLALRKGRPDIAKAIDRSFKYSHRLDKWLPIIRSLKTKRFVWRLERALLRDSVT